MATLPVIPNVFRVALNWVHTNGQIAVNVMHVRTTLLTTVGIEALLNTAWSATQITLVSNAAKVDHISITPLDGASATAVFVETNARWTGGSTDLPIPAAAQVVSLRTALRGRSHRGRLYLPFMVEGNFANGSVSTGSNAAIQTAWDSFVTGMATGTAPLVVASYLHATAENVTKAACEFVVGTQRRRQSRLRT
jgi:hypothetical protein